MLLPHYLEPHYLGDAGKSLLRTKVRAGESALTASARKPEISARPWNKISIVNERERTVNADKTDGRTSKPASALRR